MSHSRSAQPPDTSFHVDLPPNLTNLSSDTQRQLRLLRPRIGQPDHAGLIHRPNEHFPEVVGHSPTEVDEEADLGYLNERGHLRSTISVTLRELADVALEEVVEGVLPEEGWTGLIQFATFRLLTWTFQNFAPNLVFNHFRIDPALLCTAEDEVEWPELPSQLVAPKMLIKGRFTLDNSPPSYQLVEILSRLQHLFETKEELFAHDHEKQWIQALRLYLLHALDRCTVLIRFHSRWDLESWRRVLSFLTDSPAMAGALRFIDGLSFNSAITLACHTEVWVSSKLLQQSARTPGEGEIALGIFEMLFKFHFVMIAIWRERGDPRGQETPHLPELTLRQVVGYLRSSRANPHQVFTDPTVTTPHPSQSTPTAIHPSAHPQSHYHSTASQSAAGPSEPHVVPISPTEERRPDYNKRPKGKGRQRFEAVARKILRK